MFQPKGMMIVTAVEMRSTPPHILLKTGMDDLQSLVVPDLPLIGEDLVLETNVLDPVTEDRVLEIGDLDPVPGKEETEEGGAEAETGGEGTTEEIFRRANLAFFLSQRLLPVQAIHLPSWQLH
mgnify:CR=1 FL=1